MNNKDIARAFFTLVTQNKIDEAYEQYVNMNGKHHNAFYPAGFAALKKGMEENGEQFPNKTINIKNIVGDGDMVAVHSHLKFNQTEHEPGMVVVHIVRIQNGKIVEMWDCGQAIPAECPNMDGVF